MKVLPTSSSGRSSGAGAVLLKKRLHVRGGVSWHHFTPKETAETEFPGKTGVTYNDLEVIMVSVGSTTFIGESGKKYDFEVYTQNTIFSNKSAVYIFSRIDTGIAGNTVVPLYVGETGELGNRLNGHEKWLCVMGQGCSHIAVMQIIGERQRREAETDLIRGLNPVCNRQ